MELKNYSKSELQELIAIIHQGSLIRESVAESRGESWEVVSELEQKFLKSVYDAGHVDLIEPFSDIHLPNEAILKDVEETHEEYSEEEFWHELMIQFGKRDFFRSITDEEKQLLEKDDWLPERINQFYQFYDAEFSERGIDRLEIKES